MPSRVIRGEINESHSLSRVSLQADLTFRCLIVAVDDYGRMDGRPEVLKARLFPTRPEVTEAKLRRWLAELEKEGCVELYEVGERPYVQLTGWEKHRGAGRRAQESKYPVNPRNSSPPGNPRKSEDCHADPTEGRGTRDEGREALTPPTPPKAGGLGVAVKAIWPECQKAAARYGKQWRELTPDRQRHMSARLRERDPSEPAVLVDAIHGAVRLWGGMEVRNGFDPQRLLTPETIYRPGNFAKYLEAACEPERRGGLTEEQRKDVLERYKRGEIR